MLKRFLIIIAMIIFSTTPLMAVVNFPFPQNKSYANGIIASNVDNDDLKADFNVWWKKYYTYSGDLARIIWDTPSQTVSEGIGYGMVMAVYMSSNEKSYESEFDKLWNYYKKFKNNSGVMDWKIDGYDNVASDGTGAASDAEVDVALSLVMAYYQFDNHQYLEDALELMHAIKDKELSKKNLYIIKPGDSWEDKYNPSYSSMGYLGLAKRVDYPNADAWQGAIDANYKMLLLNQAKSSANLSSDWCDENGNVMEHWDGTKHHAYDAARTPWRVIMGYYWYGHSDGKTYLENIVGSWKNQAASSCSGKISLEGSMGNEHNSAFLGSIGMPFGVSSSYQAKLDEYYKEMAENVSDYQNSYFSGGLNILFRLAMSGNMQDFTSLSTLGGNLPPVIVGSLNDIIIAKGSNHDLKVSELHIFDNEGDNITIKVLAGANYSVNGNVITPSADFSGELKVPVVANDGTSNSKETVLIIKVNNPPVITEQKKMYVIEKGGYCFISFIGFTIEDADGDKTTIEILPSDNYSIDVSKVSPASDFTGDFYIDIVANDGSSNSEVFKVLVTVDSPPVVSSLKNELTAYAGEPLELNVEDFNYFDAEGDSVYLTILTSSLYSVDGNKITANNVGDMGVRVKFNDGKLVSPIFTFTIKVVEGSIITPPVITSLKSDIIIDQDSSLVLTLDNFNYTVSEGKNVTLTIYPSSYNEYELVDNAIVPGSETGDVNVKVSLNDGELESEIFSFNMIVNKVTGSSILNFGEKSSEQINVYPNPAEDFINVESSADGDIFIYSDNGSLIDKISIRENIIYSLKSGTYFVVVKNSGEIISSKMFYKK